MRFFTVCGMLTALLPAAKVAPFPAANDTAAIINATAKALAAAIK